jgi:Raf kinase inhibitor-like YbhB/YbcL family protein
MAFKLTVTGFSEGANIPKRFTCDGEDLSPALQWAGEPAKTQSFALIMDDPDAPGGVWNHWLVWDIPSHIQSLPEGDGHASLGKSGTNDFGRHGYGGPCPPRGRGAHRYFFWLFALDVPSLGLSQGIKRPALERALRKHIIAETSYIGRYERR